jgi:hypothetical protein
LQSWLARDISFEDAASYLSSRQPNGTFIVTLGPSPSVATVTVVVDRAGMDIFEKKRELEREGKEKKMFLIFFFGVSSSSLNHSPSASRSLRAQPSHWRFVSLLLKEQSNLTFFFPNKNKIK